MKLARPLPALALALLMTAATHAQIAPGEPGVQGPFRIFPASPNQDAVPLPVRERTRPGPSGDLLLAPAGGDPYFLSFAAGPYYPPAGERLDPQLTALLAVSFEDGRPADEVFAFVMFSKRITDARVAQLQQLGVRTLGRHPHYTLAAALPADRIDEVSTLPFVRWVGLPRDWQKIHPALAARLDAEPTGQAVEVWVSLYESDLGAGAEMEPGVVAELRDPGGPAPEAGGTSPAFRSRTDGWREAELERLELDLREYVEASRSFRTRGDAADVQRLTALDFVKFVSLHVEGRALHDESMALVHADLTRATWDGGVDQAAIVAVVDSGITGGHVMFNNSWSMGLDFTPENLGAWVDGRGHGTHVAGTIFGRPDLEDSLAGAAPGVASWGPTGRFWNLKIIDSNDTTAGVNWSAVYSTLSTPWVDQGGVTTPIPHLINHSWGGASQFLGWFGTEPQAVAFDTLAYDNDQLHVFSAGNAGPVFSTVSQQASAKNVLSVGNVMDHSHPVQGLPGSLWLASSRGPTGDGRWKPNVVAPGHMVTSADPNNVTGVVAYQGTSMAAPHVTGVAAQLLDHFPFLRRRPHATAALLMATALTKDDTQITGPGLGHLNNYGAGRIDAKRAHDETSQNDRYFWGWEGMTAADSVEVDVLVSQGATRLTAVLHYIEPAASVGAGQALVNDWDLWIDEAPFLQGSNSGEYFNHQSTVDNTEIRMIDNPGVNTYRLKIHPEDVTSESKIGLSVMITYGDTTPDGTLTVVADQAFVQPDEEVGITATVTNPEHVASALFLDSTSLGVNVKSATLTLMDGSTADLSGNQQGGADVCLGNILHGQSRSVDWQVSWSGEGSHWFQVDALSDNWVDETQQVWVAVDGTEPGIASGLVSTTHTPGAWSQENDILYYWVAAPDNLAGIDGYGILTAGAPTLPKAIMILGAVTSHGETLPSSATPYYFNLRAVDKAGNWAPEYADAGPFMIDSSAPGALANLASTTHGVGAASCLSTVTLEWDPVVDQHSGLSKYLYVWDHVPSTPVTGPGGAFTNSPKLSQPLINGTWYAHIAAVDVAGNVGPTAHAGPFVIEDPVWSVYCKAQTNSLGCAANLSAQGCPSLTTGGIDVRATSLRNNKSAILFWGLQPDNKPFNGGTKCVKNPVKRTPIQNTGGSLFGNDCTGTASFLFTSQYMQAKGLSSGQTVYTQFWSRDVGAPGDTNLSGGLQFDVRP